jgi:hypothetical protein
MKKLMLVLVLLAAPIATLLVSCGNSSPTSSNSPTATPTSTPVPSAKTVVSFSAAVSLQGLCLDSSDNVYVADYNGGGTNSELIKVTSAGVSTQLYQIPYNSDVATDGTHLYVGSTSSPYFTYYSAGVTTQPIVPTNGISGVAVNSNGTTLALSSGSAVGLYSLPSFSLLGSTSLPAVASGNEALAFDNNGSLYVAQTTLIIKYTVGVSGATTIAGQATGGYVDGAAITTAKFNNIAAIAVDGNGNVYVADYGNNAIRELSGSTVTTLVGASSPGFVTPVLTSPTINGTQGIAVDGSGNVFFSVRNNLPNSNIYEYIP